MSNQRDKQNITVSSDYEIIYPRKRKAFFVDKKEWERLKKMINNSVVPTSWYKRIIGFCFGAIFSFIGFALALPSYATVFYVAAGFSVILFLVFVFFDYRERRSSIYGKDQVLEYMDEIEIKEAGEESMAIPTYKKTLPVWTAKNKIGVGQGVDCKEIPLESKLLKTLTLKVSSNNLYWRAGFKLVAPNAVESVPRLLTDKSFLFHIGKNKNKTWGLSIYHDGKSKNATHKIIHPKNNQEVTLAIERNKKNFVKCFVNDSLEYNKRFNPELFKKIFLVAWGDGQEYEVLFDDIAYSTE